MLEIINKHMTLKQYKIFKFILAFSLAFAFSIAFQKKNIWLASITLALGLGVSAYMKTKVKGVIADERDYEVAGKAARYTMTGFLLISALIVSILGSINFADPVYGVIGNVVAFIACAVMLTYSFVFSLLNKNFSIRRKIFLTIFAVAMILFIGVSMMGVIAPKDTWVCEKGSWVKHGNPSQVMPTSTCEVK